MIQMELIQAIILGIVQGLTEFIPVSSSGHLILMDKWLGFSGAGLTFDVALHIGTFAALLLFFGKDFLALAKSIFIKDKNTKLAWLLVLGTIPAVVVGVLLQDLVETVFRSTNLVAFNLIWVGVLMLAVDRVAKRNQEISSLTPTKSLGIGAAQALALVPGVSRSGITITAGLLQGLDRVSATRFSFLLSAPAIAGATLKVIISDGGQIASEPALFAAGIIASAVSGYLAIKFLISYLGKHGLGVFAYYRISLGTLILAMSLWA